MLTKVGSETPVTLLIDGVAAFDEPAARCMYLSVIASVLWPTSS
jgi:hypothetical protein